MNRKKMYVGAALAAAMGVGLFAGTSQAEAATLDNAGASLNGMLAVGYTVSPSLDADYVQPLNAQMEAQWRRDNQKREQNDRDGRIWSRRNDSERQIRERQERERKERLERQKKERKEREAREKKEREHREGEMRRQRENQRRMPPPPPPRDRRDVSSVGDMTLPGGMSVAIHNDVF